MAGTGAAVPSDAIADFKANADTLDEIVSSASATTVARETPADPAGKTLTTVEGLRQAILSGVAGGIYPDTATGLAATTVGGYFNVLGTGGTFATLYRHDAGPVATAIQSYPTKAELDAQVGAAADSAAAALDSEDAAAISEGNAADSQAAVNTQYLDFVSKFLGTYASDPATDPEGNALVEGAWYYNSTSNLPLIYDGAAFNSFYDSTANVAAVADTVAKRGAAATLKAADAVEDDDLVTLLQRTQLNRQITAAIKAATSDDSSLNFNFAYNGYVADGEAINLLDELTFTRATDETGFNHRGVLQTFASGVPAVPVYDPSTREPLGLQVFEQRTNLFTNSEFQSGVGDGVGLVTLSSMDFGSGTVNAAAFGYDGSTISRIYGGSVPASTQCVISVFVEMDDGLAPNFGSATAANIANDFALVISSTAIDPTSYTVQHVSGNVYRVSAIATSGTSSLLNSGVLKFATNSNRTFKISGRQIEVGSFPTAYIPTGATAATRNASVGVIENIDTKPYWNPNEGTFVVEFELKDKTSVHLLGAVNNASALLRLSSFARYQIALGGVGLQFSSINTPQLNEKTKVAFRFKRNGDITLSTGGQTETINNTVVTGALSSVSFINLFNRVGTSEMASGTIALIKYEPVAVSDTRLQELSAL